MPLIHRRTFRVRHYECDAYGRLSGAAYLRYMQETAFDASAAAGYDDSRYQALGQYWLIRETDISYWRPARYGMWVEVETWVEDFRRTRSRRAYVLRDVSTGDRLAEAQTDWVYLDLTTSRPAPIPRDMMSAFFPEGIPQEAPPRERFPAVAPREGGFTVQRRVEWRDIDPVQHVNNAVYVAYIDDAALQDYAAHGWPAARMQAAGFMVAVRRHQIEYRLPALLDDMLRIETWRDGASARYTAIRRAADGALLVQSLMQLGWTEPATGAPVDPPPEFITGLAGVSTIVRPGRSPDTPD